MWAAPESVLPVIEVKHHHAEYLPMIALDKILKDVCVNTIQPYLKAKPPGEGEKPSCWYKPDFVNEPQTFYVVIIVQKPRDVLLARNRLCGDMIPRHAFRSEEAGGFEYMVMPLEGPKKPIRMLVYRVIADDPNHPEGRLECCYLSLEVLSVQGGGHLRGVWADVFYPVYMPWTSRSAVDKMDHSIIEPTLDYFGLRNIRGAKVVASFTQKPLREGGQ